MSRMRQNPTPLDLAYAERGLVRPGEAKRQHVKGQRVSFTWRGVKVWGLPKPEEA